MSSLGAQVADILVPLAQITGDINAIPRFKRFKHEPGPIELQPGIEVAECLTILHLVAVSCQRHDEDTKRFWGFMRWDFVFIMLKNSQPVKHIRMMLAILATSILPDTFGPIIVGDDDQRTNEKHIIERLTALFLEEPIIIPESGESPYDAAQVGALRLDVAGVLEAMCDTPHGTDALVRNDLAIGRLVRFINDTLNRLYDFKFEHPIL